MNVTTFDTHAVVKTLTKAGFQEAQAEAVVSAMGEAVSGTVGDQVATKADVADLRTEFKTGLADLRADTRADLLKVALAVVGLTVALIKLLP